MPLQKSQLNIINNPNKSFVQANFIEPNQQQLIKAGQLFILSEINRPEKNAEKIIFIIKQLLEKNYYLNEKIFLSENLNSLKIESLFESALVKSNRELLEFIDQERIVFDFRALSIIVGIIYEEQIHFSSMGLNRSFLIRDVEKSYQISDINPDESEQEIEELSSGKIFSSIISGEIPEKSYLVFCNDSLSQYLLNDDFIKILEKLKLEGATEQIKNLLNKINNYSNFSGLIIKNFPHKIESQKFKYEQSDLIQAEKKAEKLLKTPGKINFSKIFKKIRIFFNKIIIFLIEASKKIIKKLKRKKEGEKEKADLNEIIVKTKQKIKNKKILLIVLLFLIIFLFFNFYLKKNKDKSILIEENASSYEELIKQKENQIESALLYNNENRAKEIILELREIINSLSEKEKHKIKNFPEIELKLQEQVEKIQKMIRLEDPEELGNFSFLNDDAQITSLALLSANNKIYALDNSARTIYSLNLEDRSLKKLIQDDRIYSNKLSPREKNDKIYFLSEDNLIEINKEEKLSFHKIKIDHYENIRTFDIYNNRPYLLEPQAQQIYRYGQISGSDLLEFNPWIKEGEKIEARDFFIDYYVYFLDQEANLHEYLEGKRSRTINLDLIDPQLEKADLMFMGRKEFFIFDQSQKRLIVYSKDNQDNKSFNQGHFIAQYYSEKFDNVQALVINEKKKEAYLLNNNVLYLINLDI